MSWRRVMIWGLAGVGVGCADPSAPPPTPSETAPPPAMRLVVEDPSDAPLEGLSEEELARFDEGDARFELPFREAQGLGPLYVRRSCTGCHEDDGRGPGLVRRIAGEVGPLGNTLRPRVSAGATTPLGAPEGARVVVRSPPAVFGRGLLEAVDPQMLVLWQRTQAGSEVSGRVAWLGDEGDVDRIGRLGHQARAATLEDFVADALHSDMGLTSPRFPSELPGPDGLTDDLRPGVDLEDEVVDRLADYVRLLAIPARADVDGLGEEYFRVVGCATCHVPRARTRADHAVEALRDREVALYTDLLLHDMGEGLDDGVQDGVAGPREWRTAPLIGLRHLNGLLHDGSAPTVRVAIARHASEGSEANASVARFDAASTEAQDALVTFVEGL